MKKFYAGFEIESIEEPIGFRLGKDCFDRGTEIRSLDAIRKSLMQPDCAGPRDVYAIMMDIGKKTDEADLIERNLLYGAVCYSKGKLGREPVRSQGHIHKISPKSGMSTPEVYEIWEGKAIVYMQENGGDDPGRCYAVEGEAGDVIIVPPYWTHATVNADPTRNMSFGAWCDRDYGFVYDQVRSHGGIAWFPVFEGDTLTWIPNPAYRKGELIVKRPQKYEALGLDGTMPIYSQYEKDHSRFDFVPYPQKASGVWKNFIP